jgi:LmbE family N-acetylglucosaminyl deacetylase
MSKAPVVFALAAHPDDIEFMMAGTLLLLRQAGCETHYLNVSTGSCGSLEHPPRKLRGLRRREAQAAARLLGAHWHPSLTDDLEIFYEPKLLRRLAALMREIKPDIVLTQSPCDYMEDHTSTCRLAVTAAFARGMPNYRTVPPRKPCEGSVTVYHAMPQGLRDPLRRRIIPGAFVNVTAVHPQKLAALAEHRSQQGWLDASQNLNSYLQAMADFDRAVGRMSRRFRLAEGWRRHLHYGFCAESADPLADLLGTHYHVNQRYEAALEQGREP